MAVNTVIQAVLDKEMDISSINSATFTLSSASGAVSGDVTYDANSKTAVLTPLLNLAYQTAYTDTVTSGIKDAAGNTLSPAHIWSFTTFPTVSLKLVRLDETKLDVAATPIPLRVQVEATFSDAMDTASAEGAFSLKDDRGADVDGSFSWNAEGTVMTFTPTSPLAHATTYEIAIASTATSEHFTTMTKGDVNGDGYEDIIVGAVGALSGKGQAYIYSGATLSGDRTAPTGALATITGAANGDFLGNSVSGTSY